ncbi:MAG: erythromycin esterase family protein [Proteobacteria bacterium]|nr:erythromycin esterase family protein [Pseudomonadota bacterium]MCP4922246.1 erythromycin esterase family protein [Pseudomonadota bacterium]
MTTWLTPLAVIVGAADVVGVGESVHLSGGLERARAEVAEHLVVELGFRVVAMEISWLEARTADEQLSACATGSAWTDIESSDQLWAGVQPMLRRLCAFNAAHPEDPVRFIGIDIQDPWNHRRVIEAALGHEDPELRRCFGAWVDSGPELAAYGRARPGFRWTRTEDDACRDRLESLAAELEAPDVHRSLATMEQDRQKCWRQYAEGDFGGAYAVREPAMLETFHLERARVGGGKTVLLAHDDHVARADPKYDPLGGRLDRDPAVAYVNIAVGGYRVGTRLGGGYEETLPAAGSLEAGWHDLGQPRALFDRREQDEVHDARVFVDHAPMD